VVSEAGSNYEEQGLYGMQNFIIKIIIKQINSIALNT
jgi:hypothetical protein